MQEQILTGQQGTERALTAALMSRVGIAVGQGVQPPSQLSFQPPHSLLFFNYHDFSRALLTLPVIF